MLLGLSYQSYYGYSPSAILFLPLSHITVFLISILLCVVLCNAPRSVCLTTATTATLPLLPPYHCLLLSVSHLLVPVVCTNPFLIPHLLQMLWDLMQLRHDTMRKVAYYGGSPSLPCPTKYVGVNDGKGYGRSGNHWITFAHLLWFATRSGFTAVLPGILPTRLYSPSLFYPINLTLYLTHTQP